MATQEQTNNTSSLVLRFLTTKELAERWRMSPKRLSHWHTHNTGLYPRARKFGRKLLWAIEEIEKFERLPRRPSITVQEEPTPP